MNKYYTQTVRMGKTPFHWPASNIKILIVISFVAVYDTSTTMAFANTSRGLASLTEKWNITTPTFDYTNLEFHLNSGVSDYLTDGMVEYSIWDQYCQEGGNLVAMGALNSTISPIVGEQLDGSGTRSVSIGVTVQPEEISLEPNVYEESDVNGERTAVIAVCIRLSLNTPGNTSIEVNFLETVVVLTAQLTDGFQIDEILVAPKGRLVRTANQAYQLEAFQCDEAFVELSATEKAVARNQGAIIRICVRPNADARPDGVKMREIQSLTFSRTDPTISQIAVEDRRPAVNGLTSLTCNAGDNICMVETILTAQFFGTPSVVTGVGIGSMQFGTGAGSLRSGMTRALQQESTAAGTAEFDATVDTYAAVAGIASRAASVDPLAWGMVAAFAMVAALV
jgi:hypothetical protein